MLHGCGLGCHFIEQGNIPVLIPNRIALEDDTIFEVSPLVARGVLGSFFDHDAEQETEVYLLLPRRSKLGFLDDIGSFL